MKSLPTFAVVVPWVNRSQVEKFLEAWGVLSEPDWLVLMHDRDRRGCAAMKNAGVDEALERGAEVVVLLDDDCYPNDGSPLTQSLESFAAAHVRALEPQPVDLYRVVTSPPSRGTPYGKLTAEMPVAASMGFWTGVGDYCAVRQLAHGGEPMRFQREVVHGRYFPLCGMNLAFRPRQWLPWCRLIDVPRYDDIWMGWLWQREAYRRGACFNLAGPLVRHARQSDPYRNLEVELRHMRASETLWAQIAAHPSGDYEALRALLPADPGGSDR